MKAAERFPGTENLYFSAFFSNLLGETYPTTHDLARLLAMLSVHDVEATRFNELVEYTPFAVQFRYTPGDLSARPPDRDTAIERR